MTVHSPAKPASRGNGDKRERILDAAEEVFAKSGFFGAKVSDIAKAAGVADGTIYLYFKSKDDLLLTLFDSRMQRVVDLLTAAIDAADSPTDKIRAFVRTHLSLVSEHPRLAEVLTVELRQSSKFMKEFSLPKFGDFLRLLGGVIERGQQAGAFSPDIPPPIAARAIFGMTDELALAWLLGGSDKFDIVRAANWVSDMVLTGLERK